jgi:hypothetical protein
MKEMQMKFYRTLIVEVLLYVNEMWLVKKEDLMCLSEIFKTIQGMHNNRQDYK